MWLFSLTTISFFNYIVYSINTCRDNCNDGECEYIDNEGNKVCDCWISEGSQSENQCGIVANMCNYPEYKIKCIEKNTCTSLIVKYCQCPKNTMGNNCELNSKYNSIIYIISFIKI